MLSERQNKLLKMIVEEYIKTANPVGSQGLCDKLKCSSATIRNEMAYLEEKGYLEKTHTSSGRVPSEDGYRYYVDNLMEPKKMTGEDVLRLQRIFNNKQDSINQILNIEVRFGLFSITQYFQFIGIFFQFFYKIM